MRLSVYVFMMLLLFCLYQCQNYKKVSAVKKELPVMDPSIAPVIAANAAIDLMQVEPGFEVKLVAAEPLVSAPVAMTFDAKGRMWVVEMMGYMPDISGKGEDRPNGKIVILEDNNGDGVADTRKVFLDSLILPRAICLIGGGILVAESPNLWYYEIQHDRPGKRTLVDNQYAVDGNVEHQPNGLLRAMDNWIYNAKSSKRYKKTGGKWLIEPTHFRGQWGISQDNYGRLYYNDNSSNLIGDYFSPGFGAANPNQTSVSGYEERVVRDNRVYPIRANTGVNRGYQPGVLDDSLRLKNMTAACGPVIYRGDLFGGKYHFNAFVAEPAGNLIKRDVLKDEGLTVKGEAAYIGKEFIASVDERFRPVSLYNGPDGALYMVDMYRGIIQHKTYVTPYLKAEIEKRKLAEPLGCGRIYKVVPVGKKPVPVKFTEDPQQLVALLGHPNGMVRDMAQQILVDAGGKKAVPYLREALSKRDNPLMVIHAMWTLEGLSALETQEVLSLLKSKEWVLQMQALNVLPEVISGSSYAYYLSALKDMTLKSDELSAIYIMYALNAVKPYQEEACESLRLALLKKYPANVYLAAAMISNVAYKEEYYKDKFAAIWPDTNVAVNKQLNVLVSKIRSAKKNSDPLALAKEFPKGAALFASSCQTCHGADGNGIKSLAPPLNKSEWVTGNKDKLISIVLYGLTGPVKVNGHLYESPEISTDMPGIAHSEEISDEDVAQVLSFIRSGWENNAGKINVSDVEKIRSTLKGRQKAFTIAELEK
jgi:mono/diheme cytochrome c family protein